MVEEDFWTSEPPPSSDLDVLDRDAAGAAAVAGSRAESPLPAHRPSEAVGVSRHVGWVAAVLAVLGPLTTFFGLSTVDIVSTDPIGDLLLWSAISLACGLLLAVAVVVAVARLVRRRPGQPSYTALLAALVVAPVAWVMAFHYGVSAVRENFAEDMDSTTGTAVRSIAEYAEQQGVDLGPLGPLLGTVEN